MEQNVTPARPETLPLASDELGPNVGAAPTASPENLSESEYVHLSLKSELFP